MAKRKKKRTSIRTAAGVTQDKYLAKMAALAADPTKVLPVCPEGDPKPIAKLRAGVEKVASGKVGFFDKRDKGILGAVVHSMPLAELQAVPRLLDAKVGGKRRFYMQRGHVTRSCMLGVQNFDDPRALLMAYRDMAKEHNLQFFAEPGLTCAPSPPKQWLEAIAEEAKDELEATENGWRLGQGDAVRLKFPDGTCLDIAGRKRDINVHGYITQRYAGAQRRQPFEVSLLLDGVEHEPEREAVAAYRAGLKSERALIEAGPA